LKWTKNQAEDSLFSSYEKALASMDIEDEKEWRILCPHTRAIQSRRFG